MKTSIVLFSASMFLVSGTAIAGVKGTVSFNGKAPAETAIDMASDPKCKSMAPNAKTVDYRVAGGKLADVVVFLKKAPAGDHKATGKVTLDQKGCMYHPQAFGIMVGQELEIINSDPTLHNVHAYAKPGEFNQAMPKQGQKMTKKFKKAQVPVDIKCDVHKWMHASAIVVDHPFFATSNEKGEFEIAGVPDGEYDVEAFHQKLGTKSGKVKVAGGNGTVDFSFGG
ncbi:carboxypeptidase regulatory-like domain-containing protein [Myxococcota bacterium]|nr:carboxypeptidase regulatory-like domain-containing protein [Myxococcota bacterium]